MPTVKVADTEFDPAAFVAVTVYVAASPDCTLAIVSVGVLEPEILPPSTIGTLLLFHEYTAVAAMELGTVLLALKTALLPCATVRFDSVSDGAWMKFKNISPPDAVL